MGSQGKLKELDKTSGHNHFAHYKALENIVQLFWLFVVALQVEAKFCTFQAKWALVGLSLAP